jgi:transcription initiation factor TFIIIB Brf1 subunit/transcription initiation factor TFIIB
MESFPTSACEIAGALHIDADAIISLSDAIILGFMLNPPPENTAPYITRFYAKLSLPI